MKALAGVAVAPVLPVACGLAGGPQLLPPHGSSSCVASSPSCTRSSGSVSITCSCATDRHGTSTRLSVACISWWYTSSRLHTCAWRPPGGGCGSSGFGSCVCSRCRLPTMMVTSWFHGPASFNDLPTWFVTPGEFFEFLVYDQAGAPSATSVIRLTWRWPGKRHWLVRGSATRGLQ